MAEKSKEIGFFKKNLSPFRRDFKYRSEFSDFIVYDWYLTALQFCCFFFSSISFDLITIVTVIDQ